MQRGFQILIAFALIVTETSTATAQGSIPYGSVCGVERWPTKTLMDPGAGSLPTTPTDTTISHLVGLKATADPDAVAGRVPGMETTLWRGMETTLWRVRLLAS